MSWEKQISQKDGVKAFVVTENGKVNLDKSRVKFNDSLLRHVAQQEGDTGLVKECLFALFAQYKGASINAQGIQSMTVQKMVAKDPSLAHPSMFATLSKRVEEVLKELTGDEADKPFGMRKGPGGGRYVKADQVTESK